MAWKNLAQTDLSDALIQYHEALEELQKNMVRSFNDTPLVFLSSKTYCRFLPVIPARSWQESCCLDVDSRQETSGMTCGESLFLRKLVLGIPAQTSNKI
jgi:hypothetical protein